MKSLTALETLRRRQIPQAASDEQFFRDRQAYDEEDAFFEAEIAREGCLTPENCEIHIWARCGQQRPEVLRALKKERHRRSDPQGYAAEVEMKERRASERREKAAALKAERRIERERRHAQAIADARAMLI